MGNKLGHGDGGSGGSGGGAEASSSDQHRPPKPLASNNKKSGGKAGNSLDSGTAQEDVIDNEQVAEVPPPMEPMAPIPVSNSDKLGLTTGLECPQPNNSCDSSDANTASSSVVITADSVEKAIQERSYRLQELLDSERVYVCDLEHCCHYIQYMRESKEKEDHEIPMPEDLRDGKDRMIFGNIEAIYEWHRE